MMHRWQGDPRRRLLLDCYLTAAADAMDWQPQLLDAARQRGLTLCCEDQLLTDPPERAAVLVAHRLAMAPAGLLAWRASLSADPIAAPGEYLALAAARLLSQRDELLLLVARFDGSGTDGALGALVDAQTCARIAVAGFDADTELRGHRQLAALEAAGDLLHGDVAAAGHFAVNGPQHFLVMGLRQHAPVAD